MKAANILETIGNTPHIRLSRMFPDHEVWIDAETLPPSCSVLATTRTDGDGWFQHDEVPPGEMGSRMTVAQVEASYGNLMTRMTDNLRGSTGLGVVRTAAEAERGQNAAVMVEAVELIASEQNRLAVLLNDQGKTREAQRVLQDNAAWLDGNFRRYKAPRLKALKEANMQDAGNLSPENYRRQRKKMRKRQIQFEMQQMY